MRFGRVSLLRHAENKVAFQHREFHGLLLRGLVLRSNCKGEESIPKMAACTPHGGELCATEFPYRMVTLNEARSFVRAKAGPRSIPVDRSGVEMYSKHPLPSSLPLNATKANCGRTIMPKERARKSSQGSSRAKSIQTEVFGTAEGFGSPRYRNS